MPTYFLKLTEAVLDEETGDVALEERYVYIPAEVRITLPRFSRQETLTFDEYGLRAVEYIAHPPEPVLDGLEPSEVSLAGSEPTVVLTCRGNYFAPGATIVFNDGDERSDYVSMQEIGTIIDFSTVSGPITVPVKVRNPDGSESAPLDFTFTE